jgi:hypothetical protein
MSDLEAKQEKFLPIPDASSPSLTPVSTRHSRLQARTRSRSRPRTSLHSSRSYVDGHSTYFTEPAPGPEDVEKGEKEFEVTWDGPDDSMNPKNMATWRKWSVVVILAFGSLCVTCTSSLYTLTYGKFDPSSGLP